MNEEVTRFTGANIAGWSIRQPLTNGRSMKRIKFALVLGMLVVSSILIFAPSGSAQYFDNPTDKELVSLLHKVGFTGRIEGTLEQRLGRPIDHERADLGRFLFFDTIGGLNNDNSCAGCHSPTNGFGDTQSIAIGIENNGKVGPGRTGPRNQRRTPMVINTAFYPSLMWNSRFASLSGDPFSNRAGFKFPDPEGLSLSYLQILLDAQAFIPPTERVEVAGFDFLGDNFAIRNEVLRRLNEVPAYREIFGRSFPAVKNGAPITFDMFGQAIAEFELTLTFANAPIDQYAKGNRRVLTEEQKQGAILFFGRAGCVECHAVGGQSNEMFSDFKQHVIAVPQIAPKVGDPHAGNVMFDGQGTNEDFGLEQVTGNQNDRYMFRTSPLRNVALQPAFFHNGAFTRLEDAIRHHLNVYNSARSYDPSIAGVAADLRGPVGPTEAMLSRIDYRLSAPTYLDQNEFRQVVDFVRNALLDPRAKPDGLRHLVPQSVPSGRPTLTFQFAN